MCRDVCTAVAKGQLASALHTLRAWLLRVVVGRCSRGRGFVAEVRGAAPTPSAAAGAGAGAGTGKWLVSCGSSSQRSGPLVLVWVCVWGTARGRGLWASSLRAAPTIHGHGLVRSWPLLQDSHAVSSILRLSPVAAGQVAAHRSVPRPTPIPSPRLKDTQSARPNKQLPCDKDCISAPRTIHGQPSWLHLPRPPPRQWTSTKPTRPGQGGPLPRTMAIFTNPSRPMALHTNGLAARTANIAMSMRRIQKPV